MIIGAQPPLSFWFINSALASVVVLGLFALRAIPNLVPICPRLQGNWPL